MFLMVKHTGLQQKGPGNNSRSLQSFQTLVCQSQCLKIKRLSHPARKNKSWSQPVISLNSLTNCKELMRLEPKALYLHKPWEHVGPVPSQAPSRARGPSRLAHQRATHARAPRGSSPQQATSGGTGYRPIPVVSIVSIRNVN